MKSAIAVLILLAASTLLHAQTALPPKPPSPVNPPPTLLRRDNPPPAAPIPPNTAAIAIKSSPAEDALVQAAKDAQVQHQSFDIAQHQAQQALSDKQKALQAKLNQANTQAWEKVKADKHYRDLVKQITDAQAELQKAQTEAQQAFQAQAGAVQQQLAKDNSLIQGLIPIVRKENSLPDTATFDDTSQTWRDRK